MRDFNFQDNNQDTHNQSYQTLNKYLINNNINSYMNIMNNMQGMNSPSYYNLMPQQTLQTFPGIEYSHPSTPSYIPDGNSLPYYSQVNTANSSSNIYNEMLSQKRARLDPGNTNNITVPGTLSDPNNFYMNNYLNNSSDIANSYEKLYKYLVAGNLNNNNIITQNVNPSSQSQGEIFLGGMSCANINQGSQDLPGK